MFQKSSEKPLIVELMDISKQNEAILKFFISGIGKKVFNIANSSAEVEAYIIDYDFPGAQAHWDELYSNSGIPRIILSTNDPKEDRSVWVSKPLSSKNLIAAAISIKELQKKSPQLKKTQEVNDDAEELMPEKPQAIPSNLNRKRIASSFNKTPFKNNKLLPPLVSSTKQESHISAKENPQHVTTEAIKHEKKTQHIEQKKNTEKKPKTQEEIEAAKIQREKRWVELCGDRDDTSTSEIPRFTQENYFISKLIGGARLAKQSQQTVEVKSTPHSVFILPNEHLIFTEFSVNDDEFIKFSRTEVTSGEMSLHILSSIEAGKLELKMSESPEHIHNLESFIWTNSLLTSQGRLPTTLDLDKKTALKYWPSFARIEAFPYSMRIAALWHHSPDTLLEMSTKLGIPQRYVFAFYNGADALDLIERDPKKVKQQMKAKPKNNGGGLISRLFKRLLKGGGAS